MKAHPPIRVHLDRHAGGPTYCGAEWYGLPWCTSFAGHHNCIDCDRVFVREARTRERGSRPRPTREGLFQAALERALNAPTRQTRVRRVNSGDVVLATSTGGRRRVRGAAPGTGDLVGYAAPDGLHLEVECKAAGGRLSPAQKQRRAALQKAGAVYVVAVGPEDEAGLERAVELAVWAVDLAISVCRRARRCF